MSGGGSGQRGETGQLLGKQPIAFVRGSHVYRQETTKIEIRSSHRPPTPMLLPRENGEIDVEAAT